tara:strand:+ start:3990 stop:4529 length:540 start_codon:yes stop_codon:yes gene_type:complete
VSNTNDYIITTLSSGSNEYTDLSNNQVQAPFSLGVPTTANLRLKGQPYYVSLNTPAFTRADGSADTPTSDTVFYTEIVSASNPNHSASMHVGSIYLDAQSYTTFGAMFADIGTGGNNSHVELKRFTGGTTLFTLTNTTSSFSYVTASSVTVLNADWYDIYISASGNPATSSIRGIYYEI